MPIVRIDLVAGRPAERTRDLIRRVTDAVVAALDVQPEQVRVLITEIQPEYWAIGGTTVAEQAARTRKTDAEAGQA
jgi:4-oxalocrotonate tautomerase